MKTVDLSKYNSSNYKPGGIIKRALWHVVNSVVLKNNLQFPIWIKIFFLKLFGAKIGNRVVIKPSVSIKYPWFLQVGNDAWIGEGVCIDNLDFVKIGNCVCLSQRALVLTGNHNYKNSAFNLVIEKITIEDGTWIGAGAIVCPGVVCGSHSVLTAGSVATQNLEPYKVYQGNPAVYKRDRIIQK